MVWLYDHNDVGTYNYGRYIVFTLKQKSLFLLCFFEELFLKSVIYIQVYEYWKSKNDFFKSINCRLYII